MRTSSDCESANRASGCSHAARSDCDAPIGPDSVYYHCGGIFYRKLAIVPYFCGQARESGSRRLDRHPHTQKIEDGDGCREVSEGKKSLKRSSIDYRRGLSALGGWMLTQPENSPRRLSIDIAHYFQGYLQPMALLACFFLACLLSICIQQEPGFRVRRSASEPVGIPAQKP